MQLPTILILAMLGSIAAWAGTSAVRSWALRSGLLDHPNERSSHMVPTPRGGGIAIVASFLLLVLGLGRAGVIEARLCIVIIGGGLLVATLGFMDDRSSLPARWRFLGHAAAAAWVLWWMGRVPRMPVFGTLVDLSYAGPALCGLYLVWMINLFNFMDDGIDGIASVEAITTTLGGAVLRWLVGVGTSWLAAVLFVGCGGGILVAFIEHGQLKRKMGSRA